MRTHQYSKTTTLLVLCFAATTLTLSQVSPVLNPKTVAERLGYPASARLLMILGCLPAIYATRMGRWKLAITIGMLLWVTGGLAPLLLPNQIMPGKLRFYHTVEIFTQNFPLGVAAVLLLTRRATATHSSLDQPTAVTG